MNFKIKFRIENIFFNIGIQKNKKLITMDQKKLKIEMNCRNCCSPENLLNIGNLNKQIPSNLSRHESKINVSKM